MVWNTGYGVTSMQMEMSPRRERTSKEKKPANGKVGMKPASPAAGSRLQVRVPDCGLSYRIC